mmetsp:Transcript_9655/g.19645  ORF Transcript_9655/g.19645 Transcript_9655/m.19645 type:complete len:656 (+) Transcript_9655:164-2131(+)
MEPTLFPSTDRLWPDTDELSVVSWNQLLPSSVDGWWLYKQYCPITPQDKRTWAYRQELFEARLLGDNKPDIIALQEASERSHEIDYENFSLHYEWEVAKRGRMRCLTMWRSNSFDHLRTYSKDRTLITCLRRKSDERLFWIVNAHLQAGGGNEDRRLRQIHDALETVRKKGTNELKVDISSCIVCGDFNVDLVKDKQSALTKLLEKGIVEASTFDNGVLVARKDKRQDVGCFTNALPFAYKSNGKKPPSTLVAPQLIPRLISSGEDGGDRVVPTASFVTAVRTMYHFYATGEKGMDAKELDAFLMDINLSVERGSEMRFARKALEEKREKLQVGDEDPIFFASADLIALYMNELKGGKFWGVAHDLVTVFEKFGKKDVLEKLDVVPSWYLRGELCGDLSDEKEIFSAAFDNIFFTNNTIDLVAVEDISELCQPLPNANEPSDHKPLHCVFRFKRANGANGVDVSVAQEGDNCSATDLVSAKHDSYGKIFSIEEELCALCSTPQCSKDGKPLDAYLESYEVKLGLVAQARASLKEANARWAKVMKVEPVSVNQDDEYVSALKANRHEAQVSFQKEVGNFEMLERYNITEKVVSHIYEEDGQSYWVPRDEHWIRKGGEMPEMCAILSLRSKGETIAAQREAISSMDEAIAEEARKKG